MSKSSRSHNLLERVSSGITAWDRDTDHIERGFVFGGMPARSGVTSSLLVKSGWTGIDDVLSGDDNFLLANAPHGDASVLIDKLGERYEITRTSIKKWTVGSPIQGPLDALEIMLKKRPFEADQVKDVVIRMAPGSVVDNREMSDVCIQHMLAVMMIDKTATFRSAHDKARMQDPGILRQRAKVRLDPRAARKLIPEPSSSWYRVVHGKSRACRQIEAALATSTRPQRD